MVKVVTKKVSTKKKTYKKRALARPVSFAKKVMTVVKKQAEHKNITYSSSANLPSVVGANVPVQFCLSPNATYLNIVQGVGQGDRIGNKIKIVKASLSFIITAGGFDVTNNPNPQPMEVRMIIGRNKQAPQSSMNVSTLFQAGSSTATPIGNLFDQILPLNRDNNTIYKQKTFKVGNAIATGTGAAPGQNYFANNDFKLNIKQKIDITDYISKNYCYNDATSTPQSPYLYVLFLASAASGLQYNAAWPLYMAYYIDIEYIDL